MKKLFTLFFMLVLGTAAFAQSTITGTLVDTDSNEPLIGASVILKGTSIGTVTDVDGNFSVTAPTKGEQTLVISYIGYDAIEKVVDASYDDVDLGKIDVSGNTSLLSEVEVIASIAVDRKTPVAVTTISGEKVEALVGNQEYPEILRKTPSVYVTKSSGGFGDSRINVRGFDQRNTAVMINGIPVNDMENGWVYWSNWAGLADVTSNLQIQRGLGASKLAVPAVGGSINIITNAADFKKGGAVSASVGNDGYQKYGVVLSSGQTESGWAATFQATHTRGDGYVDGTKFRAYSYFASINKTLGDNSSISLTALGAPQWHHQRSVGTFDNVTLATFAEENKGHKYNPSWGMYNGEEFTLRRNFYHKPKVFLNHYWTVNDKTSLKTSAYVSFGRGGGTGPRGRIRTNGFIFDSYSDDATGLYNAEGQVDFDAIDAYNQGTSSEQLGQKETLTDGEFAGQYVVTSNGSDGGDGFIRRASMNSHNWYGVLSTLTHNINKDLVLTGGIDGRYYKGIHYRRVENLLGSSAYLSRSDDNNPENYVTTPSAAEFGNFGDPNSLSPGDNVINYWNDGLVTWLGLFGQIEYTADRLTVFGSFSGSNQGFKRVDYFNYAEDDTPDNDIDSDGEYRVTDWANFLGGTAKVGANFNINEQHNVFVNGGYFSKQPTFDNVYINFRNVLNEDVKNQTVNAVELGYGFRSSAFRANVNLYRTEWGNRQFSRSLDNAAGENILFRFENVAQVHTGVELEFTVTPMKGLNIEGMASVGNWEYKDDFSAEGTNTDLNRPEGSLTIYGAGLKVGDAAQTTFSIGANYEIIDGLRVRADYFYADNLYANFNVLESKFSDAANPDAQAVQLPAYGLMDAGISYNFDFGKSDLTIRLNVNNVLDDIYISELVTNIEDDPTTTENEFLNNRGWYGFGRTWNAGLKFKF